jgi:hypothetical protein
MPNNSSNGLSLIRGLKRARSFDWWRLRTHEIWIAICSYTHKTVLFRINTHLIYILILHWWYENHTINWSKHAKYLGVTIGHKLSLAHHISNITKKATNNRVMLYPILNIISPNPIKTKQNILKLYVSLILAYADSWWAPFISFSNWRDIDSVQNSGIRKTTGLPTFVKNPFHFKICKFRIHPTLNKISIQNYVL